MILVASAGFQSQLLNFNDQRGFRVGAVRAQRYQAGEALQSRQSTKGIRRE